MHIVISILVVAGVATLADYTWYTFGIRHTMTAGVVHGALLLSVVGGVLGAAAGRLARGLPIGMLAGTGGALAYYVFAATIDRRPYGLGIPMAWVVLWLLLAALDGRWLRAPARRSWPEVATRGVLAAGTGGLAFFAVLTTLWGRPPEGGRNYLVQFAAWTVAWAPGLLALTLGSSGKGPFRR